MIVLTFPVRPGSIYLFIRKVFHTDQKQEHLIPFKLIESVRARETEGQRDWYSTSAPLHRPEEKCEGLANRIQQIATGQESLIPSRGYPKIAGVIKEDYFLGGTEERESPDYQKVDVDTMDHHDIRSVGSGTWSMRP